MVDSLAELEFAARDTARLPGYVWALGGFVRAAGGTTIFTNEMAALGSGNDLGGLSFIFNNVFFMRYVEIESSLRRGLSVLKMRQSSHENGLLEFEIGRAASSSASRSSASPACSAGARSAASSDQPSTSSIRSSAIAPLRSVSGKPASFARCNEASSPL